MKLSSNTPSEKIFLLLKGLFFIYSLFLIITCLYVNLSFVNLLIVGFSYIIIPIFEYFHFGEKVRYKSVEDSEDDD
jgi:hypothetical protein